MNDFKKPINIISILLGVLGIAISIYFYQLTNRYKEISYTVDDIASMIYDSKNATSSLHLLDKDSLPINENVYFIRGKIWNSGNLPINRNDVRLPLTIHLPSCKKILEYKIEKQYQDTTQKFILSKINNKNLSINWKYFDPKNGFSYQIIYIGKEEPKVSLAGKILDVNGFQKVTLQKKVEMWFLILYIVASFLFGWFADKLFPSIFGNNSKFPIWLRLIGIIFVNALIGYFAIKLFDPFTNTTIPF